MDEPTIHIDILRRYDDFLASKTKRVECIPTPGYTYPHMRWMIAEIREGRVVGDKAHRWLGFIQGVLIREDHFKLNEERDFTRPYLGKVNDGKQE